MASNCNIASALPRMASERPDAVAIRCPTGITPAGEVDYGIALTYRELDARSDRIAAALARAGIVRGTRTALMVRPSPELFLLMFALFKAGAVPVLIDPGIDRRALKACLAEAAPEAFVGIPLAHAARVVLGWARGAVRINVTVGRRWFWGGHTLDDLLQQAPDAPFAMADTQPDDVAAILFTSGSTGVPKGVTYRHRHFTAQVEMLREAFGIEPGGVDLPTFPPFALFDPALGLTSVIPDMDPTRPAQADPRKLVAAIERFGVTQMFGSPALLDTLSRHGAPLPGLRRVLSAGAPVPPAVVERMQKLLPDDAQIWTPYGATECLPVAIIEGRELRETRAATEAGAGTCVGRPVPPNDVRIIAIDDAPIPQWSGVRLAAPGAVGEITVAGPSVTDEYFRRPQATALAKIAEGDRIVHRMGDLGYFDAQGRLWFCGRKTQRVGDLYTEQVEPVFNAHPDVRRTALVNAGGPLLCVELEAGVADAQRERIEAELLNLGARHPHTARVQRLLFHPRFPVDIRHNAKIGREALARWAATDEAMKVFVTGGGGFLGQAVCGRLVERGYEVTSFNRGLYPALAALGVRQVQGDLSNFDVMVEGSKGADAIFHIGAKAGAWGSFQEYFDANVRGTNNVLACCAMNGIRTLVYTSTPSVTHRATQPVVGGNEKTALPADGFKAWYPATKRVAEEAVLAANGPALATIALRPRLIWGPGDNQLLPRLVDRARKGRLRFVGDGQNKIDTTFIDNAAQAHLDAFDALHGKPDARCAGRAYFISNGEPKAVREIVNGLLRAAGAPAAEKTLPFRAAYALGGALETVWALLRLKGEPPMTRFLAEQLSTTHFYDISAARRDFGYQPKVSVLEGLKRLAEWWQQQPRG